MLWLLFLPIITLANNGDRIITYENLKLRLIDHPITCPEPENLTRDADMYWHASGGWRSYNISFSKRLVRLVGVQWQGDKVGNVFCQYKDKSKLTFPVSLQAPGLYLRPPTDSWKANKKNLICSIALDKCKFQRVEEVVKTYKTDEQLYDFLEGIKKSERDD